MTNEEIIKLYQKSRNALAHLNVVLSQGESAKEDIQEVLNALEALLPEDYDLF